jgi:hypothetical protein
MADDVERMLADLEHRLKVLQAELGQGPPARSPAPPPPDDALETFGRELRGLVASFDRLLVEAQGAEGILFRDEVVLEAATDLGGLAALHEAFAAIPGVSADLLAYARGHAVLDLRLDRPIALVGELRDALRRPFAVTEAREGRMAIEVG